MACLQGLEGELPGAVLGHGGTLLVASQLCGNLASGIGLAAKEEGLLTLDHHMVGIDGRDAETAVVARHGRIDGTGKYQCTLGIGVQGIGKEVGTMVERLVQVNEVYAGYQGNLLDGLLYLGMPVTGARLETRVAVEDGCHTAYVDIHLRIHLTQRIDEGKVVGDEQVTIVGPVARVGVVEAEVYDGLVGDEGKGITPGLLVYVGTVPTTQKGSSRVAEVAYIVSFAQHLAQTGGVTVLFTIGNLIAIGYTVAYAGYTDGIGCCGGTEREQTAQQDEKKAKGVMELHDIQDFQVHIVQIYNNFCCLYIKKAKKRTFCCTVSWLSLYDVIGPCRRGRLLLLSLYGSLAALLHTSEQFALEAVFGHLYAHELLGREYLLELLQVLFLECGTLNLYVGQGINHLVVFLLGALLCRHGTCLFPYSTVGLVLLVLQLEVEGEEGCAFLLGELGMVGDELLLLGTHLLLAHTWPALVVVLLLCCGCETDDADE